MKIEFHRTQKNTVVGAIVISFLSAFIFIAPYLAAAGPSGPAGKNKKDKSDKASKASSGLPIQGLTENEAILQALNRLSFGPRPGQVESIAAIGLEKWIDQQLHPESIDDDALNSRLNAFPTLKMSSQELLSKFPQPKVAAKREGVSVEQYRNEQQTKANDAMQAGVPAEVQAPRQDGVQAGDQGQGNAATPNFANIRTPQRVVAELAMAKVTRSVYSERQLEEQMVDFWYNHFNVYAGKGADKWLITSYERDAIRPRAMGKFRDLLEATAKSPAMLFYLDNWLSADPAAWAKLQEQQEARRAFRMGRMFGPGALGMPPAAGANAQAKKAQERGLNENYGRELMELHTLGVDGGYTQQDVINVAEAFTGWTIRQPRRDAQFFFDDRIHDQSPKMVLGHQIHAGGMKDGEEVLDILARDPHTAHHISLELAQHFVSDNPPAALVDRMAQTFLKTDGDIREVLRTMIYSPEFWSPDVYHAAIKTPFELVVSATRAVGADVDMPLPLVQWTGRIGEPLYQCQPPTGYSDKAEAWVNTGALLNRMNFSLALTANRLRGTHVDMQTLFGGSLDNDPHATLDRAVQMLLGGQASAKTRDTIEKQLNDPQVVQATLDDAVRQVNTPMIAGLVLGSPEFQKR